MQAIVGAEGTGDHARPLRSLDPGVRNCIVTAAPEWHTAGVACGRETPHGACSHDGAMPRQCRGRAVAENRKAKKIGNLVRKSDQVTPYDHLLYLLFEFEQTLERGDVEWSAGRLERIQTRLAGLARRLARASDPDASS